MKDECGKAWKEARVHGAGSCPAWVSDVWPMALWIRWKGTWLVRKLPIWVWGETALQRLTAAVLIREHRREHRKQTAQP